MRVYSLEVGRPAAGEAGAQPLQHRTLKPPRLSIVVLPFVNMGGDPEQEYFVDGVTESLTTDLSRISGSFVIARNTAFTYKGKTCRREADRPGVECALCLEGSVNAMATASRERSAHRRGDWAHLWAERFDKPVTDLFDMQDEIVAGSRINCAAINCGRGTPGRTGATSRIDRSLLPGHGQRAFGGSPANLSQARDFFEQAVTLDPDNVEALVGLAHCEAYLGGGLFGHDRTARLTAAATALDRALSLAPNNASAHKNLGHLMVFTNRATQALSELERALKLDPNLAAAHASIGLAKITLGRAEETERHIDDALRLSPLDVTAYLWVAFPASQKRTWGWTRMPPPDCAARSN